MNPKHPGLSVRPIYLDYNATTPVDPLVVAAMMPFLAAEFGNPSSAHAYGQAPRDALLRARGQVAALIGASGQEIVFTGSGSEADALAIRGAALAALATGRDHAHVVTQVTEHPAVLAACHELQRWHGVEVSYLPVDSDGVVDPDDVAAAITANTVLVSVMHANNETGTLQGIADIAEVTRSRGVLLHSDAAQSVGKVPVDVDALGVDLLTVVGHKVLRAQGHRRPLRPSWRIPAPPGRRRRPGARPARRHRERRSRGRTRRSRGPGRFGSRGRRVELGSPDCGTGWPTGWRSWSRPASTSTVTPAGGSPTRST